MPAQLQDPPKPQGRNSLIGNRVVQGARVPGWLPTEIKAQSTIAQQAFILLTQKPGRSLRSIANEIGCSYHTISGLSQAGRWALHLSQFLGQSNEALGLQAQMEARRSRSEMLATNRLAEAAIDAALGKMIEVDDCGNVRLRDNVRLTDVHKVGSARIMHIKATQLLTGEEAASRRAAAAAGATRIVLGRDVVAPEPMKRAAGKVVE